MLRATPMCVASGPARSGVSSVITRGAIVGAVKLGRPVVICGGVGIWEGNGDCFDRACGRLRGMDDPGIAGDGLETAAAILKSNFVSVRPIVGTPRFAPAPPPASPLSTAIRPATPGATALDRRCGASAVLLRLGVPGGFSARRPRPTRRAPTAPKDARHPRDSRFWERVNSWIGCIGYWCDKQRKSKLSRLRLAILLQVRVLWPRPKNPIFVPPPTSRGGSPPSAATAIT